MELTFGPWLKKRRRVLDLTQDDLAERATCSVNTIRKIESGDLIPSKALAQEIAHALDVPSDAHAGFVQFARDTNATASENAFTENPPPRTPVATTPPVQKFAPPAPLTAAIGRERETNVIVNTLRLPAARLITLTGAPGTGKTRLALEIAAQVQSEFQHGAAFVGLAPVAQADMVENAIAQALDVHEAGETNLNAALEKFLRDKHLLLVLDNVEHLLESASSDAAQRVTALLRAAPRLKILATSREPLRVYGEREFPIAPLELPPLAALPSLEEIEKFSAVQLFVERAQAVETEFELTAENMEAVARLCVGLDGLPLAIELAAARIKYETPRALLAQWNRRLDEFTSGMRDRAARQQTLRGAIDWSYERLTETEQRVLRQLGVFRGGFTLEQANAVCETDAQTIVLALVEKSLAKHEISFDGSARFTLLEMIREYALEKLGLHGEAQRASERHWQFFTTLAQELDTDEMRGASSIVVARLNQEHDNARRALDWAIQSQQRERALTLTAALAKYWYYRGYVAEAQHWISQTLTLNADVSVELAPTRARVRSVYADILRMSGEWLRARELFEQSVSDWRAVGEAGKPHLAFALVLLSRMALWQGDADIAYTHAREGLELFLTLNDPHGQASAWRRLGEWAMSQRDSAYARECLDNAVALQQDTDYYFGHAVSLLERGDIARATGEYERAQRDYAAAARVNERANDGFNRLRLTHRFGVLAALQGDPQRGEQLLRQALELTLQQGAQPPIPLIFASFAYCAAVQQKPRMAMRALGVMDTAIRDMYMVFHDPEQIEVFKTEQLVNAQAVGEWRNQWRAEGRAKNWRDARAVLEEISE